MLPARRAEETQNVALGKARFLIADQARARVLKRVLGDSCAPAAHEPSPLCLVVQRLYRVKFPIRFNHRQS